MPASLLRPVGDELPPKGIDHFALTLSLLVLLLLPSAALACSGPDVEGTVRRAELISGSLFVASLLASAAATALYVRRKWSLVPLAAPWALLLGHPFFWLRSTDGDCGSNKVVGSFVLLLVQLGLVWALRGPRASVKSQ